MSRPRLTDEQRAAAERGAGDACVLAGAGTGKTTVLTARFERLVAVDRVPVRRVAALTFTDKAAHEMRARIAAALASSPDARVAAAARDVEFAPISTLHAFGARLLRENALLAGVDPAFDLLDEVSATLRLEDAWATVERRLRREGDARLAVLRRVAEADPGRVVRALFRRLRGLGVSPRQARVRPPETDFRAALADLTRALEDYDAATAALPGPLAQQAAHKRARFPTPEQVAVGGFRGARPVLRFLAEQVRGVGYHFVDRKAVAERKALVEAYQTVARAALDDVVAAEVEPPVADLLGLLDDAYTEAKAARGLLDFEDLEHRTLALLDRLEARGRPLPGRPERLLVDEYQDVNPVQANVLERLRRSAAGPRVDQFAVGDPKQSIYRFRRADVAVMQREWASVGEPGRARLSESFRSRPEVVAFCNAVFGRLFRDGAAGTAFEPLVARGTFHPAPVEPPELLVVDGAHAGGDLALAEARAVVARIRAWVDGGALRTKVERGPDGAPTAAPRPLRWGDVAVLLRSRGRVKVLERALVEAGVPFQVGRGRGFYQAQEIEDLLTLLRVVHDPLDEAAVAAWLTSPAVGATDADLLETFRPGHAAFDLAREREATRAAALHVDALRTLAARGSLEAVVRAAVDAADAVETSLLQTGGERRARNLRKAVAIARRLDDDGRHGLLDFLRVLTDLRDRRIDEAEAATAGGDDAVSVLTVHAAKGLEWPCVILADTSRRGGGGDRSPPFHVDDRGRVAWRVRDPVEGTFHATGAYEGAAAQEKAAEAQEALRLLYVALTRAEERLVVTAAVEGAKKDGGPSRIEGFAKALWPVLDAPFRLGVHDVEVDGAAARVTVVAPTEGGTGPAPTAAWFARAGAAGRPAEVAPPTEAELSVARARWAAASAPVPSLGRTPFVASISELLAFARSPAAYYAERLVGEDVAAPPVARPREADDPAAGAEGGPDLAVAEAARADRWDEAHEVVGGVDRTALGRAVHLALERWTPGDHDLVALARAALAEELPDGGREAEALAVAMLSRFVASPAARAVEAALAAGREVRREAAFHARIRFPDGQPVAGFPALLLKGTVDLWVADDGGALTLFDHKTNAPGRHLPDVASVVARYETQLRLYALAAERLVERDVAGASLLLLDPAWGAQGAPVAVPVDVSGPALAKTRALCRAFAVACLEDRWPQRWESL